MEGFHPILFGIAQQARPSKAYHGRSVVTRSGLPQDHISHHDMTPSMSLSKDSKKRNTSTERTVQTGPAVRNGCDTSSARRHSRSPTTSSRPANSPATTGWPMETEPTSSPATEKGSSYSQASYHAIRTPLRDTSRIPHVISSFTRHHPAGREEEKNSRVITTDNRYTQVPRVASPLLQNTPRNTSRMPYVHDQQPHRSSLD